ncbi:MAG: acetyl-CoA carboxylase carboxyltransferase subunit alpha [Planctomycetota bacterium]
MSSFYTLDFEKPVAEIERRIRDAETLPPGTPAGVAEVDRTVDESVLADLREQRDSILAELYAKLDPWDTVRVSRHPDRPQSRNYIESFVRDFAELHGDRRFGDDPAIITGLGRIGSHKCMVVGHQKGRTTQERIACHFGCAHPEGYRKALLKMQLAEKMGIPIVTLVDTPGAYPGLGAEERGQAEAIAVNLREMSRIKTPIVSVVIGEGGSGGALGIAVADRVAMMQYAWYSVISPEGCAAILWKQANETTNAAAATALNLTATDNLRNGIIDDVVEEPVGGAHRHRERAAQNLTKWITSQLDELVRVPTDELLEARYQRFRRLGEVTESTEAEVEDAAPQSSSATS